MPEFDIVIYHANCPDGFTGAWAFWIVHGTRCEYLPYRYGQEAPAVIGKTVAIVDFSFPRQILLQMAAQAKYLAVLDHHKTAERDLAGLRLANGEIIFDMNRSGAQIAWDYLCRCGDLSSSYPWFVDYVADRDLWRHALPHTKEISEALFFDGYYQDFELLQELLLNADPEKDKAKLAARGATLLEYKNKECECYAKAAVPVILKVQECSYHVNLAGCPRSYRSEVGNIICATQDCEFAAVYWYDFKSREWWVSLRAADNATVDLSEVSGHLPNGGGHPKAAGFTIYGEQGQDLYTYFGELRSPKPLAGLRQDWD